MNSPVYAPSAGYSPPRVLPWVLGARTCSLQDFMTNAVAWEIVLRHMPAIKYIIQAPSMRPLLENMRLSDFGVFGGGDNSAALDAIDADLARLTSEGAAS